VAAGAEVLRACELHEARAWEECVAACAAVEGNPLRAKVVRVSETPVPVVAALNYSLFNRVIALGVAAPARDADIAAIEKVYAEHEQTSWAVCLAPGAAPADLAARLESRGLQRGSDFAKVVRSTENTPSIETALRIEEIGPDRRNDFVAVNVAAWGVPPVFSAWFGGTLGRPGWRHYLGYDGNDPVSAGALYVSDNIGWLGFGATLPDHRGRGGQSAIMARRIRDAAQLGCAYVHTETAAETPDKPNPSYRNMIATGFDLAYLRPNYTPIEPS